MPPEGARGGAVGRWLPVALYVAVIFTLSSIPRLPTPIHLENGDKLAHTLEYGGLGFLLVRALRGHVRFSDPLVGGLVAVAIGALVGMGDELYQRLIPGRESAAADWFADLGGLIFAQVAYLFARRD